MTRESRDCRTGTPWGRADSATTFARGIVFYNTPGHGGFHVARGLNARMPDHLRRDDGWYEEDCDWCLVAVAFPGSFTPDERADAERTFRNWHPDRWERHHERALVAGESFLRDRAA